MRKEYAKHFETRTRVDSGKTFIACKDDAPEELRDLIQHIHFDLFEKAFPSDWIYLTILEAFEALEDDPLENINIEPDVYYHELYKWFGEPIAHILCIEAQEEGLCEGKGIYEIIGTAQFLAKEKIYHAVNDFIDGEDDEITEEE
jgi:hypothetical protein